MFARLISPLLLLALLSSPCRAQSQDPASNPSTSAKPATPPGSEQAAATQNKKPKKVWTNDDMGSVKGTISVIGDPDSSAEKGPVSSTGTNKARQRQIENYRSRIRDLQSRIDAADKRIVQLRNFKAEDASPSGGLKPNHGYDMVPLEEQVKQLEDKKRQLQGKIEDVENEARKNGIDTGELR